MSAEEKVTTQFQVESHPLALQESGSSGNEGPFLEEGVFIQLAETSLAGGHPYVTVGSS